MSCHHIRVVSYCVSFLYSYFLELCLETSFFVTWVCIRERLILLLSFKGILIKQAYSCISELCQITFHRGNTSKSSYFLSLSLIPAKVAKRLRTTMRLNRSDLAHWRRRLNWGVGFSAPLSLSLPRLDCTSKAAFTAMGSQWERILNCHQRVQGVVTKEKEGEMREERQWEEPKNTLLFFREKYNAPEVWLRLHLVPKFSNSIF